MACLCIISIYIFFLLIVLTTTWSWWLTHPEIPRKRSFAETWRIKFWSVWVLKFLQRKRFSQRVPGHDVIEHEPRERFGWIEKNGECPERCNLWTCLKLMVFFANVGKSTSPMNPMKICYMFYNGLTVPQLKHLGKNKHLKSFNKKHCACHHWILLGLELTGWLRSLLQTPKDLLITPPKMNMDTKIDDLENLSPFNNGYFRYLCYFLGGVHVCFRWIISTYYRWINAGCFA